MTADQAALLDRLVAEARLRDLLASYADVIDWLDWPRLDSLFWPDAAIDFGSPGRGNLRRRKFAIVQALLQTLGHKRPIFQR